MGNNPSNPNPQQIGFHDVYERLWHCRDFELKNFWQRSVFLGTFLTLSYIGYGMLCMKAVIPLLSTREYGLPWEVINLFAVGLSCFGLIFSALWILMAKGSKMWYEWQEKAIVAFVRGYTPNSAFEDEAVRTVADFGIGWTADFDREWKNVKKDHFYHSCAGGPFSVSKITICIGQISLLGWLLIGCFHLILLALDQTKLRCLFGTHSFVWGGLLFACVVAGILFVLRQHVRSDVLTSKL